ncbi:uncharacterized protein LOC124273499 [Haliotis rubra]|uniref:uncharacterized protein LOC124273499 n=1 Tax=Haliotis rubra TaxID=36100 RepID=UPI001EE5C181|nr:uncharacterized protein LOC124273499 [Haliotis rubra]
MLKICLLYCLCLASGQFLFGTNVDVSSYGGYTFEYHSYSDLLIVKDLQSCYFMRTNDTLSKIITDKQERGKLQIELLGFILSDEHVKRTSFIQADITHRDVTATSACVGRDLYEMKYPADGAANKQGKTTAETTAKSQLTTITNV